MAEQVSSAVVAGSVTRVVPAHVERRRRVLARAWALATVGWSLVRTVLAWVLLRDHGLNPWVYLCVDLSSSLVLGQSLPRTIVRYVDDRRRSASRWGVLTAIAYAIPDVYLFSSTERIPPATVAVIVTVILAGLVSTAVTVVRRVRAARAGVVQWWP